MDGEAEAEAEAMEREMEEVEAQMRDMSENAELLRARAEELRREFDAAQPPSEPPPPSPRQPMEDRDNVLGGVDDSDDTQGNTDGDDAGDDVDGVAAHGDVAALHHGDAVDTEADEEMREMQPPRGRTRFSSVEELYARPERRRRGDGASSDPPRSPRAPLYLASPRRCQPPTVTSR